METYVCFVSFIYWGIIYELTWSIFPNRLRTPPKMTCARVNLKTCIARGLLFGLKGAAPFKAAPGGSTNVE